MSREREDVIDVARLVDELKARVAKERAAGEYGDDLSGVALEAPPSPQGTHGAPAQVRLRPELGFSSKPVIGPVITLVKKVLLRLLFFVLEDLAQQTDAAVKRLEAALAAEALARKRGNSAEAAAREGAQADIQALSQRADRFEAKVEGLHLVDRLARLERRRRVEAPVVQAGPSAAAVPAVSPSGSGVDYLAFEARFRPEESVREHQQIYVEFLGSSKRVVDLGCGRGELIELLRDEGVGAYGVEIEPDFIELLEEKGIEVVAQDAVAHLGELEPGAVDGIVVSHVVEHLPTAAVTQLVQLAADKLAGGGLLIVETPNPESLVAGSINFHRDPTHLRPIHPDTLSFLCESAGFSEVEIRRLSPVPEAERLPAPESTRLDEVVQQLNDLLYGYQDYAVIARKWNGGLLRGMLAKRQRGRI